MQHYGQLRDEEVKVDLTNEEALGKIERLLKQVKLEYRDAEKWLKNYYAEGAERDER
jgi:osomolarity two-component system phosphorelay intermediate protein YPD1